MKGGLDTFLSGSSDTNRLESVGMGGVPSCGPTIMEGPEPSE